MTIYKLLIDDLIKLSVISVSLTGYCGADIKAVCSEAALCALRRCYPQIYASSQKLLLDIESISVEGRDFLSAMRKIVPASQRAVASPAKALTLVIQPLLANTLRDAMKALQKVFPHVEQGVKKKDNSMLNNPEWPFGFIDRHFTWPFIKKYST